MTTPNPFFTLNWKNITIPQIDAVLAQGHSINDFDDYGRCPLILAASYAHCHILEHMIKKGANPKAKDIFLRNAAFRAVETHNLGNLKILEKHGTDLYTLDKWRYNLFLMAVEYESRKTLPYLLEIGINPLQKTKEGKSWQDLLRRTQNHQMAAFVEKELKKHARAQNPAPTPQKITRRRIIIQHTPNLHELDA